MTNPTPISTASSSDDLVERLLTQDKAMTAHGLDDDTFDFWDRVKRIEEIITGQNIIAEHAAEAVNLVSQFLSNDGECGHVVVVDADITRLMASIANLIQNKSGNSAYAVCQTCGAFKHEKKSD